MSALVLDCKTSGLWRKDLDPQMGNPAQPWIVRLAAGHFDTAGSLINAFDLTIKPKGRKIKEGAESVHGISAGEAEKVGLSENFVLLTLADMVGKVSRVVTFGDFDPQVVENQLLLFEERTGRREYWQRWRRPGLEFLNIQRPACQQVCKLPSTVEDGGYAWPSLDVACETILGTLPRQSFHHPWEDLSRVDALYRELLRLGHFEAEAA